MPLIFNMDGTKMSKRDKAKFARKSLKDAIAKDATLKDRAAGLLKLDAALVHDFLSGDNDSLDVAAAIAAHFKIGLPEVQVSDFREAGYQPEPICNFLSLLGWNPGMKTEDGKDLEKFNNAFLAQHFGIERIGRTNAKFDRAKLLSFNADAIAAMDEPEFARRFRAWCEEFDPALPAKVTDAQRWLWLCRAVKQRAKTMRDGAKAAAFALLTDDGYQFDQAAAQKNLLDKDNAGLKMLDEVAARLATVDPFEPQGIHVLLEQLPSKPAQAWAALLNPSASPSPAAP
jgi:glutamyl/glutaminyl-tRNA synthetase